MTVDTRKRSLVKSITWRILGVILLGAIAYYATGSWVDTGAITLSFHGIRVVMYYYFERCWERISWGRKLKKGNK